MSDSSHIPLLLLKTKSTPHDGYQDYFSAAENGRFCPIFVPVLQHRMKEEALQLIRDLITSGSLGHDSSYGGLIFTSQRSVEAFSMVVETLSNQTKAQALHDDIPFYVVGPATAQGLRSLSLPCPILGEGSGNGEKLAEFILEDSRSRWKDEKMPKLLFLVGEKRRDIIPKMLQSDGLPTSQRIEVEELVVYETQEMSSFSTDFDESWSKGAATCDLQWVVVFSPTGCEAMLRCLALLDHGTGQYNGRPHQNTLIATIGPTTRDFLIRKFGLTPDACATKPSPEGLAEALAAPMNT